MATPVKSALCLLVSVNAALIGCARDIEVHKILSPDGRAILRLENNVGGGAAVADQMSVFLVPTGGPHFEAHLVFRGTAMDDFAAKWLNDKTVAISFRGGYVSTCIPEVDSPAIRQVHISGCTLPNPRLERP